MFAITALLIASVVPDDDRLREVNRVDEVWVNHVAYNNYEGPGHEQATQLIFWRYVDNGEMRCVRWCWLRHAMLTRECYGWRIVITSSTGGRCIFTAPILREYASNWDPEVEDTKVLKRDNRPKVWWTGARKTKYPKAN